MSVQRKHVGQADIDSDPEKTQVESDAPAQPDFLEKTIVTRPVQAESSQLDQAFSEKTVVATPSQLRDMMQPAVKPAQSQEFPPGMPPLAPPGVNRGRSARDPFARKPNPANRAPVPPSAKLGDMSSANSQPSIVPDVPKLPRRKSGGRAFPKVNAYAVIGVIVAASVLFYMATHIKGSHQAEVETVSADDFSLTHDASGNSQAAETSRPESRGGSQGESRTDSRREAAREVRPEGQTIDSVAQKFEQAFFKSQNQILPQAQ